NTASYDLRTAKSDGIGSLAGDSQSTNPGLTFVEDGTPQKGSEFTAYTWAVSNPSGGIPSVSDFTLSLLPGSPEPGLWGNSDVRTPLSSATVRLHKILAGQPQAYATYSLSDVTISSFSTADQNGGAAGQHPPSVRQRGLVVLPPVPHPPPFRPQHRLLRP